MPRFASPKQTVKQQESGFICMRAFCWSVSVSHSFARRQEPSTTLIRSLQMVRRFFSCFISYRFAYAVSILAFAALLRVPRAPAQTESATVLGRVTDPTGAVVN